MRKTRWIFAGLLCAALSPAAASAQRMRDFEDSWFWGVKGGVSTLAPTLGDSEAAATYGVEWLITRSRGGLYISLDEANVSTISGVFDPTAENSIRQVQVDKLRRLSFAALAFPKRFGRFLPYGGLGVSVNVVGDAFPLASSDDETLEDAVFERVDERRSLAAFLGMAGVQMQFQKLAVFGQATVVPSNARFLLNDQPLGFFEMGVRYNFSGSREGLR
ncbi:MAG TPA: hypothetical protein VM939_07025 [Gemmatimonadaceae bacterium]|nr:hypothetical protein [Gemmatimonadaceae bacterium]